MPSLPTLTYVSALLADYLGISVSLISHCLGLDKRRRFSMGNILKRHHSMFLAKFQITPFKFGQSSIKSFNF